MVRIIGFYRNIINQSKFSVRAPHLITPFLLNKCKSNFKVVLLFKIGSHVIEEERRRVLALKQKAQHEVRTQWAQRQQDCCSLTSIGSEEATNR